jgi:hypothetical protein
MTKQAIIALAATLTALSIPSIASAQAIVFPPSYSWSQLESTSFPTEAPASVQTQTNRGRIPSGRTASGNPSVSARALGVKIIEPSA